MDRNTIPNINRLRVLPFNKISVKYNTRLEIQFPTFIILRVLPLKFRKLHCNANDSLIS
jgi:hypothetical protein